MKGHGFHAILALLLLSLRSYPSCNCTAVDLIPFGRRRFYVNCGAAIAATFTPALRTGETCPGDSWNPRDYWSRQHIGKLLDASVLAQPAGVESVMIKAMKRKYRAA
eukprot:SAG25_NODE_7_length_29214_cov_40.245818_16_plen_107_part_00